MDLILTVMGILIVWFIWGVFIIVLVKFIMMIVNKVIPNIKKEN